MSAQSRSSMEFRHSLRSEEGGDGKESVSAMKRRCNGISSTDLVMNTSPDLGLSTRFGTGRRSLITRSQMGYSSRVAGERLRLSRSNTTIVQRVISSLSISISRLWKRFLTSRFGLSPWWRLLNGTTGIRLIRQVFVSGMTLRSALQMKSECTSVDQTGGNHG